MLSKDKPPPPPRRSSPPPPTTPPPGLTKTVAERCSPRKKSRKLWIVHDNVALSNAASTEVLVETKKSGNLICFVLGRIAYSGPVSEHDGVSGVVKSGARGACLLELHRCHARIVSLDQRCRPGSSNFECLPLDRDYRFESWPSFFADCDARVDIILSPQRFTKDGKPTTHEGPYLPYWDNEEPPRKLAPQFRSAGVGYIRLGDDMSRNGLAFVSADGSTFLSDGGAIDPPLSSGPTTPTTPLTPATTKSRSRRRRRDPTISWWTDSFADSKGSHHHHHLRRDSSSSLLSNGGGQQGLRHSPPPQRAATSSSSSRISSPL